VDGACPEEFEGEQAHSCCEEEWGIKACAVLRGGARFPDRLKRALLAYHATTALSYRNLGLAGVGDDLKKKGLVL